MRLEEIIEHLRDQADLYNPLPSAFRTRRQSREDRLIERVLRFIIVILEIINNNNSLEDIVSSIVGRINFLDERFGQ